ncbi:MAG: prenyltransferase [Eubacteriales bacterium]
MNIKLSCGLKGVFRLFRIVPVLSWSTSAVALGLGLALYRVGWAGIRFSYLFLLVFVASMFQGFAAHAINDLFDWYSGTDRLSEGILSGGTDVIKNNLLRTNQVRFIGWASLILGLAGGLYLVRLFGVFILVLLLIGVWSTVAYSAPPVRLAYHPLAGEWLAAWPATIACTVGTFYVLTGDITPYAVAGGILHATFSISWLMQHHLPDIDADLRAVPCKLTTVALVSHRWGKKYTRYVVMGYFFLFILMGLFFGLRYNPAFFISIAFGLICVLLAYKTNTSDIEHITSKQVAMIVLSIGHALSLAVIFALRLF